MSLFALYLQMGIEHILDVHGLDHILFIVALCVIFEIRQWKKMLILVTAFTVGHSLTLALAALNVLIIDSSVVEFLIPVTILITCISNIGKETGKKKDRNLPVQYPLALIFGLIHGLGFSNYFKSLLGKESSVILPLFSFNLGIEAGQIVVVLSFMLISYLINTIFKLSKRDWSIMVSASIASLAIQMAIENRFW